MVVIAFRSSLSASMYPKIFNEKLTSQLWQFSSAMQFRFLGSYEHAESKSCREMATALSGANAIQLASFNLDPFLTMQSVIAPSCLEPQ